MQRGLEPWPAVLALYSRALAIVERLSPRDPANPMLLQDLWMTSLKIAEVETITGAYDAALANYRKGLAAIGGSRADGRTTLALQSDLALSHSRIGITLNAMKQYGDALKEHRAALAIRERIAAAQPERHQPPARGLRQSHPRRRSAGRPRPAPRGDRQASGRAVAIVERLVAGDPGNAQWQGDLIGLYDGLGRLYIAQGETAQALDAYQRALEARERRSAIAPDNRAWQADLAAHLRILGRALHTAGRVDDGIAAYRRSAECCAAGGAADTPTMPPRNWRRSLSTSATSLPAAANGPRRAVLRGRAAPCASGSPRAIRPTWSAARSRRAIERVAVRIGPTQGPGGGAGELSRRARLRQRVMAAEPANVALKRDYVLTLSLASDVLLPHGRAQGRCQQNLLRAFAIVAKYAADFPDNPVLQADLAIGLYLLAYHLDDDPSPRLERARAIVRRLEAEGKLAPEIKAHIAQLEQKLADKPKS